MRESASTVITFRSRAQRAAEAADAAFTQGCSQRLHETLEAHGFRTPDEKGALVAHAAHVGLATAERWLRDGVPRTASPERLVALAETLGLHWDWLAQGTGPRRLSGEARVRGAQRYHRFLRILDAN